MRRISIFLFAFFVCLTLLLSGNIRAAETLDSWESYVEQGDVTITTQGSSAMISASSAQESYGWGQIDKDFPGSCGASATFSMQTLSNPSSADATIGLRKYLGMNSSGNVLLAEIYLLCWQGDYSVYYKIRERTTDYQTVKILARGRLGDYKDAFNLKDEVTIGLGKTGCDVVFYSTTVPGLTKVSNCNFSDYPAGYADDVDIAVYCDSNSNVTGTVNNVNIAYTEANLEEIFGSSTIKGYEKGYEAGSHQSENKPGKAELLTPWGSTTQYNGSFYWNTVLNSTWYQLWVNDSTGTPVINKWYKASEVDTDAGYCFLGDQTLSAGQYSWWVRTWNSNGAGPWSSRKDFTISSGD